MEISNSIFYFIYNFSHYSYIAKIALFLSYPFTYGSLLIIAIWAIFFSKRKIFNFSLLFMSAFFSWMVAGVLKNIFQASRPFHDLTIVALYNETGYSFPSQHMAIFTAIAVSMFLINKRAGYVFTLIAILVGLSRMVIGVHYPIDVVGGAVIGLIISLIFTEIFKKI